MANKHLLVLILMVTQVSFAETDLIVPEDVSQESVTPRFDSPEVVKNRLLAFSGKIELGLSQGWILDEPYLNNSYQILSLSYGLNEFHGAQLKYFNFNSGTSNYAKVFNSSFAMDFSKVPNPKYGLIAGHQYRFSYGKLSFSQWLTVPTTLELQSDFGFYEQGQQKNASTQYWLDAKDLL